MLFAFFILAFLHLSQPNFVGPQKLTRPTILVEFNQKDRIGPGGFSGRLGGCPIGIGQILLVISFVFDDPLDNPGKEGRIRPWVDGEVTIGLSRGFVEPRVYNCELGLSFYQIGDQPDIAVGWPVVGVKEV